MLATLVKMGQKHVYHYVMSPLFLTNTLNNHLGGERTKSCLILAYI